MKSTKKPKQLKRLSVPFRFDYKVKKGYNNDPGHNTPTKINQIKHSLNQNLN